LIELIKRILYALVIREDKKPLRFLPREVEEKHFLRLENFGLDKKSGKG